MKLKAIFALSLALGLAFAAAPSKADDYGQPAAPGAGMPGMPSGMQGMSATAGAMGDGGGMAGKMVQELGLSSEQAAKFKEEAPKHRAAMQPLREKRKGLMQTLESQVKAAAGDEKIEETLSQLESVQKSIDSENASYRETLKSFLSPTQQAKVLITMSAMMAQEMMR